MMYIVKLAEDKYVEWSTIVDAPETNVRSRSQMLGRNSHITLERIDRADQNGTSSLYKLSLEDLIECNRAGEHGENLTLEEIIERYTE